MDDLSRNRDYPLPDPRRSAAVDADRNRTTIEKIDADVAAALAPATVAALGRVILGTVQNIRAGDKGHVPTAGDVKEYVSERITALIDGSPEALDTLVELSKALNDDPHFAATVAAQIGLKADKATIDASIAAINAALGQRADKSTTQIALEDRYTKQQSDARYVELKKSGNDWTGFKYLELKDTASDDKRLFYNAGGTLHWSDADWTPQVRIHSDGNMQGAVWANQHNNFLSTYVDVKASQAQNWAYQNLIQDVRLSGWWETGRSLNNWVHCPSGGVVTAWLTQQTSIYDVVINVLGGRFLQALRNGNWFTVGIW